MASPPDLSDVADATRSPQSEITAEIASALARLRAATERPPCAVVLGERNSGKTSVVNALLADGLLPSSVIGNTHYFALVRHAESTEAFGISVEGRRLSLDGSTEPQRADLSRIEIGLPNRKLKTYEVLDTPGRVGPADVLDLPWLPPVRIPIWCTVATQAWKESERWAWTSIDGARRRHGVLVVTALDRIANDQDAGRLTARLMSEAAPYFIAVAYAATEPDVAASGLDDVVTVVSRLATAVATRRKLAADKLVKRIESLSGEASV